MGKPFSRSLLLVMAILSLSVLAAGGQAGQDEHTQLVDVGGYKLSCRILGEGAPTVVFMGGFRVPQAYWGKIPLEVAERCAAVTFDRPGYGKSESAGARRDGEVVADELKVLLDKLEAPKPYILVAHSLGTVYAPTFAAKYPGSVAGMILLDPGHKDMLDLFGKRLKGAEKERWDDYWRNVWVGSKGGTTPFDREQQGVDRALEHFAAALIPKQMPVYIISALDKSKASKSLMDIKLSSESIDLYFDGLENYHNALIAKWSNRGRRFTARGSSHMIPLDAPDFVCEIIRKMIDSLDAEPVKQTRGKGCRAQEDRLETG